MQALCLSTRNFKAEMNPCSGIHSRITYRPTQYKASLNGSKNNIFLLIVSALSLSLLQSWIGVVTKAVLTSTQNLRFCAKIRNVMYIVYPSKPHFSSCKVQFVGCSLYGFVAVMRWLMSTCRKMWVMVKTYSPRN